MVPGHHRVRSWLLVLTAPLLVATSACGSGGSAAAPATTSTTPASTAVPTGVVEVTATVAASTFPFADRRPGATLFTVTWTLGAADCVTPTRCTGSLSTSGGSHWSYGWDGTRLTVTRSKQDLSSTVDVTCNDAKTGKTVRGSKVAFVETYPKDVVFTRAEDGSFVAPHAFRGQFNEVDGCARPRAMKVAETDLWTMRPVVG